MTYTRTTVAGLVPFVVTHGFLSAIVGPTIVVVFGIGVADPVTAGWPTAIPLFVAACVLTCADSAAFAIGLIIAPADHPPRSWRLKIWGVCAAVACLVAAPIAVFLADEVLIRDAAVPFFIQIILAVTMVAVLSFSLGWLTKRCS